MSGGPGGVNVLELVNELRDLNARKKAGEALSPALEARRQELKSILQRVVESSAAPAPPGGATAAASPSTTTAAGDAKPYAPPKNAFAIDAGALLEAAAKSEAVAKIDPFAKPKPNPPASDPGAPPTKSEVPRPADPKAEPPKPEPRKGENNIEEQLKSSTGTYTPPITNLVLEQYYGDFVLEGYQPVNVYREQVSLKPIDPREIEIAKVSDATTSLASTVPPGLAFLDDFPVLYARRIVPAASDELVIDSTDPTLLIPGKRKVTVHLLNGEKRQGVIRALRRGDLGFRLEPLGSGQIEEFSMAQVKAVFIHLQPNATPKDAIGRALTATFSDGRSIQGQSDDYQPGMPVFTLVPPAGRGQFERILVNAGAVTSVM